MVPAYQTERAKTIPYASSNARHLTRCISVNYWGVATPQIGMMGEWVSTAADGYADLMPVVAD